jgi:hypothetical protein
MNFTLWERHAHDLSQGTNLRLAGWWRGCGGEEENPNLAGDLTQIVQPMT